MHEGSRRATTAASSAGPRIATRSSVGVVTGGATGRATTGWAARKTVIRLPAP